MTQFPVKRRTAVIAAVWLVLLLLCVVPIPRCNPVGKQESQRLVFDFIEERVRRGQFAPKQYLLVEIYSDRDFFVYEISWPGKDPKGGPHPQVAVYRPTGFVDWVSGSRAREMEGKSKLSP